MGFREVSLNLGSIHTADGSAAVKIGNTAVVCGIKAVSIFYLFFDIFNMSFIVLRNWVFLNLKLLT